MRVCVRRVASGSLLFSIALGFFGPRPPFGMLAGEAVLKFFDLFFDFLFAFAGLKKDIVRVSALPFEFAVTVAPVVLVFLFIALQKAGEFVVEFRFSQVRVISKPRLRR
jgi:hypothetical protein